MKKIPESMKVELQSWNNGKGIELEAWTMCSGNFSLAVGYAAFFCPNFVEVEGYIIQCDPEDVDEQTINNIKSFESQHHSTKKIVEWVINHFHITDIQYLGCEDVAIDKIIFLGETLKDIYQARLHYLFPDKPCIVEFYKPEDPNDLEGYQLSYWQIAHG